MFLFVVRCVLFGGCCLLRVVRGRVPLFVVSGVGVCLSLCVVCCLLFVVRCVAFVV